jgi:DNA-binding CsgD family transcriptional regulator
MPQEDLEKTAFYQEIMRPQGWRHAVALCFWGDPPAPFPVLVLTANRKGNRPDFSDEELRALRDVHDVLDGWVADLVEHTRAVTAYAAAASLVGHAGRGFMVLDQHLTVRLADAEGRNMCAKWTTSENSKHDGVPHAIGDACEKMYATWRRTIANGAQVARRSFVRVVRDRPGQMIGRITMNPPKPHGLAEPSFFVELWHAGVAQRKPSISSSVHSFEMLTAAERAVVEAAGAGLSNKEIAERLGKTVYAVKFLLHQVYVRTGIPNRTRLAMALRRG